MSPSRLSSYKRPFIIIGGQLSSAMTATFRVFVIATLSVKGLRLWRQTASSKSAGMNKISYLIIIIERIT